ncbi:consortin, connexin sorting protein b [Trichomycterus rosablanca]|uniref:consortin, connexin sorting protein b n=1 Tax=Trichomycterus rosablanca TaxID=2290929 RepID=UPI002F35331D
MDGTEVKQDLMSSYPGSDIDTTGLPMDDRTSGHLCRIPEPSPSFLAALSSLGEHDDHMLLPNSLHQISEAYFLEEDYQWALLFLSLERLYHEKLLFNLASMQEECESQWKAGSQTKSSSAVKSCCSETESKYMDSLSHICRTHQRPHRFRQKDVDDHKLEKQNMKDGIVDQAVYGGIPLKENESFNINTCLKKKNSGKEGVDEVLENEDLVEMHQEEVEENCGEELTKLIEVEETFPSNGLVSILKKRACVEKNNPADHSPPKSSKPKVRFSETADTVDNDEVGGDSCLVFFFLCLVTVVISMGGTMLYCFLGGAYSSVCTDFSNNMDFYFGPVRRGVDTLTHWFTPASS